MKSAQYNNTHKAGTKAHELYAKQFAWNNYIERFYDDFIKTYNNYNNPVFNCRRLNSCRAYIEEVGHYIYLRSYSTIVAVYDKNNNSVYDVLRLVYGYTPTSSQHITKFVKYIRNNYDLYTSLPFYSYKWDYLR